MLTQLHVQRYKSLYDVTIDLAPLTVFIGPNGSGKSNICEALRVLSYLAANNLTLSAVMEHLPNSPNWQSKYWHGNTSAEMSFRWFANIEGEIKTSSIFLQENSRNRKGSVLHEVAQTIHRVVVYDLIPTELAKAAQPNSIFTTSGHGIANALTDILFDNRDLFIEMEAHFTRLVPNVSRISLKREKNNQNLLQLIDKYSEYAIPASDISDGTLRILGFLTALYQLGDIDILCLEEPENGIHPWLLHKLIELLNLVSQEGLRGKPIQILITTHSPVLLNYVEPEQVRAVELDEQGATQVHALPVDSKQFQAALEAYDGELGELWFTNLFGGNPT